MGRQCGLIVTNLESESLALTAVHVGQFMMFLKLPTRQKVILCSVTLYLYMNGKVSYP